MAIPELAGGTLPAGVHHCTLEEAEARFAHPNPHPKRGELWQGLLRFLEDIQPIRQPHLFDTLFVDGSFTTDKEEPGDIDIVLEANSPGSLAIRMIERVKLLHILDEDRTQRDYGLHVFLAFPGDDAWVQFFQTFKPAEAQRRGKSLPETRGILRVTI